MNLTEICKADKPRFQRQWTFRLHIMHNIYWPSKPRSAFQRGRSVKSQPWMRNFRLRPSHLKGISYFGGCSESVRFRYQLFLEPHGAINSRDRLFRSTMSIDYRYLGFRDIRTSCSESSIDPYIPGTSCLVSCMDQWISGTGCLGCYTCP